VLGEVEETVYLVEEDEDEEDEEEDGRAEVATKMNRSEMLFVRGVSFSSHGVVPARRASMSVSNLRTHELTRVLLSRGLSGVD